MQKVQLLSQPDGNILQLLTDPRMITLAVGATVGGVIEKTLWTSNRSAFGYAINTPSGVQYFDSYEDFTAKKPANPKYGTNRQLARLGLVLGCVAGIEYIPEKFQSSTRFFRSEAPSQQNLHPEPLSPDQMRAPLDNTP